MNVAMLFGLAAEGAGRLDGFFGSMFWSVTKTLFSGFCKTAELFGLTLLFAIPLGLIVSFGSMSKFRPLKWLVRAFVWVIRGTPLMLQLIVVYYGPGLLGTAAQNLLRGGYDGQFLSLVTWVSGWTVQSRLVAALVAFVINYACYFSEIYRGGIESISAGQYEACQVLGMTRTQAFFRVVLLQVVKRIVPPMGNEIITLVKDTSLARTIAVYEVLWNAQKYTKTDGLLWPLLYSGVFYLAFTGLLTILFRQIEKKMDYFKS